MSSPTHGRLPDFILGGAPKAATSTLSHILKCHDDVFIRGENDFFTIDDFDQHPEYFLNGENGRVTHDYNADFDKLISWYTNLFAPATSEQKPGDYSTNYLASAKAPRRIHELIPHCKLIFVLRDPVQRAHSEYWHHLKRGRVTRPFRDAIQFAPRTLLKNSCYKRSIQHYLRYFPRENVHILLFERFIEKMQEEVDEVCDFLGLAEGIDLEDIDTHRNVSRSPRWPGVQRVMNRVFQRTVRRRGSRHLPDVPDRSKGWGERVKASLEMRFRAFNLKEKKNPPMNEDSRAFLRELLATENRGLSELIGIDVRQHWDYL